MTAKSTSFMGHSDYKRSIIYGDLSNLDQSLVDAGAF